MGKKFSTKQQNDIRQKLINIFEERLREGRPNKITIDNLVKEAGIAKGSFYHFFPSKEMLFVAVINQEQERILKKAQKISKLGGTSKKEKLKKILFIIIKEIKTHPWLQNLSGPEFEQMIQRLPQNLQAKLLNEDKLALKRLLKDLVLSPKLPLDDLLVSIEIILASASHAEDFGRHYDRAVKTMINGLVDTFFDERKDYE